MVIAENNLESSGNSRINHGKFVAVENDSLLGDVLRLRFHPHLGGEFRGRRMHQ